jgi:hypothetical protein
MPVVKGFSLQQALPLESKSRETPCLFPLSAGNLALRLVRD